MKREKLLIISKAYLSYRLRTLIKKRIAGRKILRAYINSKK
jgi:hypothetical protein